MCEGQFLILTFEVHSNQPQAPPFHSSSPPPGDWAYTLLSIPPNRTSSFSDQYQRLTPPLRSSLCLPTLMIDSLSRSCLLPKLSACQLFESNSPSVSCLVSFFTEIFHVVHCLFQPLRLSIASSVGCRPYGICPTCRLEPFFQHLWMSVYSKLSGEYNRLNQIITWSQVLLAWNKLTLSVKLFIRL